MLATILCLSVLPTILCAFTFVYGLIFCIQSLMNGEKISEVTVNRLSIMDRAFVSVKIGNKPGAKYEGGFNLFGKHYGDYNQDIVLTMEY